jgi:hypothetical protein
VSNVFSLDSLREAARKKYEPVRFGLSDGSEVLLKSLFKLEKPKRQTVVDAIEQIKGLDVEDDDEDAGLELLVEEISKIFNAVADKPAKLLKDLDDPDLEIKVSLMTEVLNLWAKETQLGEAQNSPA